MQDRADRQSSETVVDDVADVEVTSTGSSDADSTTTVSTLPNHTLTVDAASTTRRRDPDHPGRWVLARRKAAATADAIKRCVPESARHLVRARGGFIVPSHECTEQFGIRSLTTVPRWIEADLAEVLTPAGLAAVAEHNHRAYQERHLDREES